MFPELGSISFHMLITCYLQDPRLGQNSKEGADSDKGLSSTRAAFIPGDKRTPPLLATKCPDNWQADESCLGNVSVAQDCRPCVKLRVISRNIGKTTIKMHGNSKDTFPCGLEFWSLREFLV